MKVCIPEKQTLLNGGPKTFTENLKIEMEKQKISYTQRVLFPKILFFSISSSIAQIQRAKSVGGKVIQRLDGIYHPLKYENYKDKNKIIELIYNKYADIVIFQSEYSKRICFEMFGEKSENEYEIITNGANTNIFFPSNKLSLSKPIKFITTGSFRDIKMLKPIIEALKKLYMEGVNLELVVVGNISKNIGLESLLSEEFVSCMNEVELKCVADLLRLSDIFIYSYASACPNSVIEAISCGLPVVAFNNGSMSELCNFNLELLSSDDSNETELAEKAMLCIENYGIFRKKSIEHSKDYPMSKCAAKYISVFEKFFLNKRGGFDLKLLIKSILLKFF